MIFIKIVVLEIKIDNASGVINFIRQAKHCLAYSEKIDSSSAAINLFN
jgi:hypothetical protein